MSAALAAGTKPIFSPVAGEMTSKRSAESGSCQPPSMYRPGYSRDSIFSPLMYGWTISRGRHAAVDAEHGSGDEAAAGPEQEEHRVVELAGPPAAAQRRARQQELRKLLGV